MDPMANARISGDEAGSRSMNNQPRTRPTTRSTTVSRIANAASSPGQPIVYTPSQIQGFSVDLTNLDDEIDTKSTTGAMTNNPHFISDMGTPVSGGMGSIMMQQSLFDAVDAAHNLDSEALGTVKREDTYDYKTTNALQPFNMAQIAKFESQAPEPINTNTRPDAFRTQPFGRMSTIAPPPQSTPAPAGRYPRGDTVEAVQEHTEHVPPNRITEAGPVTHPDRDWRPYGTNHWHVFLESPDTLKYLSTAEIKEIREHCNQLNKSTMEGAGNPGNSDEEGEEEGEVVLPIPNTGHTTADAQTVWAHCDAYIRRRGQLRNNNAARRSRQRRDAELRYWKRKAVEYGCPDHEFVWDGKELPPDPSANAYASMLPSAATTAAAANAAAPPPGPAPTPAPALVPVPVLAAPPPQTQTRGAARRSARVHRQRQAAATAAEARMMPAAMSGSAPASNQPANQGSAAEHGRPFDPFA